MRTTLPSQLIVACLCLLGLTTNATAKNASILSDTSKVHEEIFPANGAIVYEPVCAETGKTYVNKEAALADGATEIEKGRCSTYEPIKCEEPNRLWISEVDVNGMSEKSAAEGYRNATNVIFDFYKYDSNIVSLHRKPNAKIGVQQWKVWIDFDGDTVFEDDEAVIDEVAQDFAVPVFIPDEVELGTLTRMRVFIGRRGNDLDSDSILLGEVEDYTVQIIK